MIAVSFHQFQPQPNQRPILVYLNPKIRPWHYEGQAVPAEHYHSTSEMKTSSPEGLLKKDYLSVTVLKSDAVETTCSCAPLTKNRNAIVIASVEFEGSPLEIPGRASSCTTNAISTQLVTKATVGLNPASQSVVCVSQNSYSTS